MAYKIVSEEDIRELLRNEIERAGGQSEWARREKIHRPYLNKMLAGTKPINPTILKKLNIKTAYVLDD